MECPCAVVSPVFKSLYQLLVGADVEVCVEKHCVESWVWCLMGASCWWCSQAPVAFVLWTIILSFKPVSVFGFKIHLCHDTALGKGK